MFDDESKSLNNNKKNPLVVKTKLSSLMMKVSNNKLFACKEIEEKIKKGFTKRILEINIDNNSRDKKFYLKSKENIIFSPR